MIQKQCECVNFIAQGDVPTMILSGFTLSKEPTPHQVPDQGLIRKIRRMDAGTASIITKAIKNVNYYELQIEGPANFNTEVTGTHCKFKVSNLPLDVTLRVKVRGINNKGIGLWSPWAEFTITATAPVGSANAVNESNND